MSQKKLLNGNISHKQFLQSLIITTLSKHFNSAVSLDWLSLCLCV